MSWSNFATFLLHIKELSYSWNIDTRLTPTILQREFRNSVINTLSPANKFNCEIKFICSAVWILQNENLHLPYFGCLFAVKVTAESSKFTDCIVLNFFLFNVDEKMIMSSLKFGSLLMNFQLLSLISIDIIAMGFSDTVFVFLLLYLWARFHKKHKTNVDCFSWKWFLQNVCSIIKNVLILYFSFLGVTAHKSKNVDKQPPPSPPSRRPTIKPKVPLPTPAKDPSVVNISPANATAPSEGMLHMTSSSTPHLTTFAPKLAPKPTNEPPPSAPPPPVDKG